MVIVVRSYLVIEVITNTASFGWFLPFIGNLHIIRCLDINHLIAFFLYLIHVQPFFSLGFYYTETFLVLLISGLRV
ncbi:uncharacterized protein B0J16DRAFT_4492 [Fusarium flagelliforme]|uniref:uncharacterized protein n=1 Tax=Fusarium flagelliforme TaxID=2675880 RepID=UPI001E8E9439|nr:uncharacterized protein B0J16DRAFT_4492 [Fusarium flagelliforme]KAH7196698.1 hypothetical protein B0J16DRAFT_4492 [Fusarium flagelliforme]